MSDSKVEKSLADHTQDAIRRLPGKRITSRESMKQVTQEAVKANALAKISPDDEDWVKRNKEVTASVLADLTAKQLDYQWEMQYALWSSFIKQR